MSKQEIQTLIADLCREMEFLWRKKNYVSSRDSDEAIVKTRIQDDVIVLPKSQFPIRGAVGVAVTVTYRKSIKETIVSLIIDSLSIVRDEWNKDCLEIKTRILDYENRLISKLALIPNLLERVSESLGYKHYEPEVLAEKIKTDGYVYSHFSCHFLPRLIAEELCENGFDPEEKLLFEAWDEIALGVTEKIYSIAKKTHNNYAIVIFLSAPVLDCKSPIKLGDNITIEYASDDLLSRLHRYNRDVRLDYINTAIQIKRSVSVNASVEQYQDQYSNPK